MANFHTGAIAVLIFVAAAACMEYTAGCRVNSLPQPATNASIDTSFYGRLGDSAGVAAIIDSLLVQVRADPAISQFFATIDTVSFKAEMAQQLCQITNGPVHVNGPTMEAAHHGMNIDTAQFNAFIGDYLNAMNSAGVSDTDRQHVLQLLISFESQIIGQ